MKQTQSVIFQLFPKLWVALPFSKHPELEYASVLCAYSEFSELAGNIFEEFIQKRITAFFFFFFSSTVAQKYCDNDHFSGVSALLTWVYLEASSEKYIISDPQNKLKLGPQKR